MTTLQQTAWRNELKNEIRSIDEELKETWKSDSLRNLLRRYTLTCQQIELLQALIDNNNN